MIFGCCFLGSFKPGHFHYPVTCRTEKNLLLVMATGRAGKGRPASLSAVVAAAGLQRPQKQRLTPGHLLLGSVHWGPRTAEPSLGPPHGGKEAECVSSVLDILTDTLCQPDGHTPWAQPLAAHSHLLSVDRAFSQIFTTFWAVNIHIRK